MTSIHSASIVLGDDPDEITVTHVPSAVAGHPRAIVRLGGNLAIHCGDTPPSVLLALADALAAVAYEQRQRTADRIGDAA